VVSKLESFRNQTSRLECGGGPNQKSRMSSGLTLEVIG